MEDIGDADVRNRIDIPSESTQGFVELWELEVSEAWEGGCIPAALKPGWWWWQRIGGGRNWIPNTWGFVRLWELKVPSVFPVRHHHVLPHIAHQRRSTVTLVALNTETRTDSGSTLGFVWLWEFQVSFVFPVYHSTPQSSPCSCKSSNLCPSKCKSIQYSTQSLVSNAHSCNKRTPITQSMCTIHPRIVCMC